jgi:hypothetical protein
MTFKFSRFIFFAFFFLVASRAVPLLWSQDAPSLQRLPQHSEASFASAANRWQLTAIDPRSQVDTVSPGLRAQRNAYWKGPLEAARSAPNVSEGAFMGTDPEFPVEPDAAWVIATFEGFHVFAIDPEYQLIYTEMNFRVEQVFKKSASLSLSGGSLIDADIIGGRIKSPTGEINSLRVGPHRYFFQVGHKYLLLLSYQPTGGFYWAAKRWDLSSGKVEPDGPLEIERAARGKSSIAGMSIADLVNYLPSVLPDEPRTDESNK